MKKISVISGCIMAAILLISATKKNSPTELISLEGVWELQHQFIFEDGKVQDTLFNLDGYRQVKVYSKGKVMWTRYNPADSNEWFGYGSYKVKNGMLEERLEYASNSMMKIIDTVQVFKFELEMKRKAYSQISFDNNGEPYVSENYKRVE